MRYADYTCDDRGVCLCACNAASIGITVQKWLNGSTLLGPKEHCVRWGILIPLLCFRDSLGYEDQTATRKQTYLLT